MPETKFISSVQNPLVKKILALKEKSRERKKTGLFVIEGQREIQLALKGGYELDTLLVCPEIIENPNGQITDLSADRQDSKVERVHLTAPVYEKLAHRGSTEGVLAIATTKDHALENITLSENPLLLIAESTEKPGNLGALLRTADAANLDAVLVANPKSDVYNPNVIRSSVGCIFTQQLGIGSSTEIIRFLKEKNMKIFGAALTASKNYVEADFTRPCAIVVGTESTGLTAEWMEQADQNLIIPMQGEIDSMNLSVSAAILIFEAKRQRGF